MTPSQRTFVVKMAHGHSVSTFAKVYEFMRLHLLVCKKKDSNITKTRPCNIQRFFTAVKMTIFSLFFDYFHIFAQNIYCGYTLEHPQ